MEQSAYLVSHRLPPGCESDSDVVMIQKLRVELSVLITMEICFRNLAAGIISSFVITRKLATFGLIHLLLLRKKLLSARQNMFAIISCASAYLCILEKSWSNDDSLSSESNTYEPTSLFLLTKAELHFSSEDVGSAREEEL